MKDVTDPKTILEYQGDRVLVLKHRQIDSLQVGTEQALAYVLTIVNVVNADNRTLYLTNRDSKTHKPDWPLTQALFDHLRPAGENKEQAKWALTVKGK